MNLKLISILFSLMAAFTAYGIEPTWSVDFGSVFDNREGDDRYYPDKTFFFTTLAPEVGLKFTPSDRISGGIVWNQPLMNGIKEGRVVPMLYYRHEGQKWKFSMGMFPRTQLREPLPGFLWCDSLAYFQKNIRGALLQYEGDNGFADAYIDWRAHQTENRREAFNIVAQGLWHPGKEVFIAGARAMMNHFAKTLYADDSQSIVDNFLINPYIGVDLSRRTVLDSLVIKAGGLLTVERYREYNGWRTPGGLWLDLTMEWKWLGLKNSLYKGKKLLPLYGTFGTLLYQGESYYQSDFYNRTDVYAKILRNKYMELEGQLNFNVARGNFMFYQRLILNIHLGNL